MPTNFGTTEILIIAIVIMIFFGGKKIPEFIRGLGGAVQEFKKGVKDDEPEKKKESSEEE